jgi:hypothetical protein
MFQSLIQKSKAILGVNRQNCSSENDTHTCTVEDPLEATTVNCEPLATEDSSKRCEELRETVYGNVVA